MARQRHAKKMHREARRLRAYGSKPGRYWCRCDTEVIPDYKEKPRKKTARQEAKRAIRKAAKDGEEST